MIREVQSTNYQKVSVKKTQACQSFYLAIILLILLSVSSCNRSSSQLETLSSPSPEQIQSSPSSLCGVVLSSEIIEYERLCSDPKIIDGIDDISPQTWLANDQDGDWSVFECDIEYSHNLASTTNRRICGTNSDGSRQEVLIQQLVGPVLVSKDGQWLVFATTGERPVGACRSRLYKMRLDGAPIALTEPSELNICWIHNLQWQHTQSTTWVRFRNWNGSGSSADINSMPLYRVNFETGDLEQITTP